MTNGLCIENYEQSEIHRKKIMALKNYSQSLSDFGEASILELLAFHLERGTIHKKLHRILDDLFDLYKIDYLQWWFENDWVKEQICIKDEKDKNTRVFRFYKKMNRQVSYVGKGWLYPSKVYKNKHFKIGEREWV